MNIDQMRYFVAAVDEGSLSAAARQLSVTTQCVSKAVGNLEKEIGIPLLVRTGQGARATAFGEAFAQRARYTLRVFDETVAFTRSCTPQDADRMRPADTLASANGLRLIMCLPYFPRMNMVAKSTEELVSKSLGIATHVSYCPCVECVPTLEADLANMAVILGEADSEKLDLLQIGTVPCGVQVAAESPLAKLDTLRVTDVLPYPAFLWPGHDHFNNYVRSYFDRRGFGKPFTESPEALFFSKETRAGAMFIPRIASLDTKINNTVPLTFDKADGFASPIQLATLKGASNPFGIAAKGKMREVVSCLTGRGGANS